MPSGNFDGPRGHRTKQRYLISKEASVALKMLAWTRYGRPTTDEETNAVLSALVMEEKARTTQD